MRSVSLLLSTCGVVAAWMVWHVLARAIPAPPDAASVAGRLGLALAWLLPSAALLWAMLLVQMTIRFVNHAFDPLAPGQPPLLGVNQRVITNTLEHGAVFSLALLALAAVASSRTMPQVLALAAVFALARVVFWGGYLIGPLYRAPGMAATAAATGGALGGAAWVWIVS
jgi:hypothetical protein